MIDSVKTSGSINYRISDSLIDNNCSFCRRLVQLLKHDRFSEIRLLLKNRWRIVCCTLLSRAEVPRLINQYPQSLLVVTIDF